MALYSVWDWNKNLYRVYADQRPVSVGVDPHPPRPSNVNILGAVPYDDCKTLPAGARSMGLSHVPRGEIVRQTGSVQELLGLGDNDGGRSLFGTVAIAAASAAAGFLVARLVR
jgi:hypothetical protein